MGDSINVLGQSESFQNKIDEALKICEKYSKDSEKIDFNRSETFTDPEYEEALKTLRETPSDQMTPKQAETYATFLTKNTKPQLKDVIKEIINPMRWTWWNTLIKNIREVRWRDKTKDKIIDQTTITNDSTSFGILLFRLSRWIKTEREKEKYAIKFRQLITKYYTTDKAEEILSWITHFAVWDESGTVWYGEEYIFEKSIKGETKVNINWDQSEHPLGYAFTQKTKWNYIIYKGKKFICQVNIDEQGKNDPHRLSDDDLELCVDKNNNEFKIRAWNKTAGWNSFYYPKWGGEVAHTITPKEGLNKALVLALNIAGIDCKNPQKSWEIILKIGKNNYIFTIDSETATLIPPKTMGDLQYKDGKLTIPQKLLKENIAIITKAPTINENGKNPLDEITCIYASPDAYIGRTFPKGKTEQGNNSWEATLDWKTQGQINAQIDSLYTSWILETNKSIHFDFFTGVDPEPLTDKTIKILKNPNEPTDDKHPENLAKYFKENYETWIADIFKQGIFQPIADSVRKQIIDNGRPKYTDPTTKEEKEWDDEQVELQIKLMWIRLMKILLAETSHTNKNGIPKTVQSILIELNMQKKLKYNAKWSIWTEIDKKYRKAGFTWKPWKENEK